MSFGEAESLKVTTEKIYRRQLVLLEEIKKIQLACDHILSQPNSNIITCTQCGAVWIK